MSATMQRKGNRSRQHHMPNRGAYPNSNNYGRRETPEPEPANSSPSGLYADPRTALVMCSFMGTRTTVKTRNGSTYKGHTTGFSDKGDIAMSDAKLDDDGNTQNPNLPGIIIGKDNFVVARTNGVDLRALSTGDFTDSGIVSRLNGSSEGQFKELQPWHDDDAPETSHALSLDDPTGGWDSNSMFQVNTEKFNVQSSYNENMHEYTTKLPDPRSEGYEEREKFAQRHAEEIERSETYQTRIAKELTDGDEESRYSAVHRGNESQAPHRSHEANTSSGKNTYVAPALRGEGDQVMRNGNMSRGQANRLQRQNSPYSSASHPQQQQQQQHPHHPSVQNNRTINNHYSGPQMSGGPLNRNQGPLLHPRQQQQQQQQQTQNHAVPPPHHHNSSFGQPPPPSHPGMQQSQHQPPVSSQQQQQRPSPHHQMASPTQVPKSQPPPHHHPVPSSISQPPPPQAQQQQLPPQKMSPPHSQPPSSQHPPAVKGMSPNVNGPSGPPPNINQGRQPMPMQVNGDGQNVEAVSQKVGQGDLRSHGYHQQPPTSVPMSAPSASPAQKGPDSQLSASSSSNSLVDGQQMVPQSSSATATSPPAALAADGRVGRGSEPSPEEARTKTSKSLREFKDKFVLESNDASSQEPPRQEDGTENPPVSSNVVASSVGATPVTSAPEAAVRSSDQTETQVKTAEKTEVEAAPVSTFKLNPNAKEFKPKSQAAPVETQSPSPQPRSSPLMTHPMVHLPQQAVLMYPTHPSPYMLQPNQLNQQRKRATVSLSGASVDLAAHQVTGQPLLATQQPMIYIPGPGQPLPPGFQVRMVTPSSLAMAQTGQVTGLDQTASQNQPQPVFMPQQPQVPIPAHLPTHAQPLPHPSTNQQATPTHVPNPAPSPVHHQQHNTQTLPQNLPHHLSQGPPQSATPQPAHYPQPQMSMSFSLPSHAIPAGVPRTSMSGQQNVGHQTVSISSYPLSAPQYTSYPNGSTAQYTYTSPAQPQTSQNSSHGPGPQPQYVMMPQPSGQGVPPMQQHTGQPYATGIPFQPQHNLMQGRTSVSGPPQLPPNHGNNPSQGGPHLIHSGMPANIHQQVSGSQPGMYMQVPSTLQQFQHPQ